MTIKSLIFKTKQKLGLVKRFTTSEQYWIDRYKNGGNSGAGSYNNLAEFKAKVLNPFVANNEIKSVIEYGCGDGNQLVYFTFPKYTGFDVSQNALDLCKARFSEDSTKEFYLMDEANAYKADLTISLDVLYHLIEDEVFYKYLRDLFDAANKYVIIYACDKNNYGKFADHVKPRAFTGWIKDNVSNFEMIKHIPNDFPFNANDEVNTSFADFYIFRKSN